MFVTFHVLNHFNCSYFISFTGICYLGFIVLGVLILKYIVHADSHFGSSFKWDYFLGREILCVLNCVHQNSWCLFLLGVQCQSNSSFMVIPHWDSYNMESGNFLSSTCTWYRHGVSISLNTTQPSSFFFMSLPQTGWPSVSVGW